MHLKRIEHPLLIESDGTTDTTKISVGGNVLSSVTDAAVFLSTEKPNHAVVTISLVPLYTAIEDVRILFDTQNLMSSQNTIDQLEKLVSKLKEKMKEESK